MKTYGVYVDDQLEYIGYRYDIEALYGISQKNFYAVVKRHGRFKDKYEIRILQEKVEKIEEMKEEIKKTPYQKNLEYILLHLKGYGYHNCITMFDPVPYLPDLYDLGFDCKVREIETIDGERKRKKSVHYILECV